MLLALLAILALPAVARAEDSPFIPGHAVIAIWPGPAPGGAHATAQEAVVERAKDPAALRDRYVRGVTRPTLTVFRPAHPNGAALLMAPGGGYAWVVMDKEGYEAAERFAASGVTVFVMTYRLPQEGWAAGPDTPLQDAQRALRLVRFHAGEYGVGPHRIGVMGFSAGGHVAGLLTLAFDRPVYAPIDAADQVSARPDLSILMYPVASMDAAIAHAGSRKNLLGDTPTPERIAAYSLEDLARPDAPPVMLVHAIDDRSVPVENSLRLMAALRAVHVPVEAHLFEEGGHGFGIRFAVGKPAQAWPDLVLAWMKRKGMLG
ncbi:alpha/beta hydrolase [Phenylobacterium aquaticum]|uniref:alpha/beta hydrolase n=1 Tax=Phenylobacterium aquaticum TaxID=1763816 RepID=UPI001F5C556E|nr:alpha/beta hydrolase [Phenylobacterium aquaticum]MCI3131850.1 alpha/beta hydrolase [Phenylobacterium aquaticum]